MINGSPTDNNAKLFKAGAHCVLDDCGVKIGKEYDTPDWSPDKAQQRDGAGHHRGRQGRHRRRLRRERRHGRRRDRRDEVRRHRLREIPTTGQDAELAAIQRILAGEQFMTVYKAIKPEAEAAAELAVALAQGEEPPSGLVTGEVDNGSGKIPSMHPRRRSR